MYNINILSYVDDDNIRAAIIAATLEMINSESSLVVNRMKRGNINSPVWNSFSRQENLNNKF